MQNNSQGRRDRVDPNVRKDPSPDGEVVTVIDCLSKVMVDMKGSTDEFYKVCTASGAEGFCMRKYIALKR